MLHIPSKIYNSRTINIAHGGQLALITLYWRCPHTYKTNTCGTEKLSITTIRIFRRDTHFSCVYINMKIDMECKRLMAFIIADFTQFNSIKGEVIPSVKNENLRAWKHMVMKIIQECIIFARNAIHILINI